MANDSQDQTTSREHWLPQTSHLQQFGTNGEIHVYRYPEGRKTDFLEGKHFTTGSNAIAVERDMYERPDLPVNTFENAFSSLEGLFGTVLEDKIKQGKDLSDRERQTLGAYVDALQHRTPSQRDHWNSQIDRLVQMGRQVSVAHGHPEAGDRFAAEFEEVKKTSFTDAIAIALDVGNWSQLDYCFLVIDPEGSFADMNFISSDHPVSLVDFASSNSFHGIHPRNQTAESVAPLTSKIALFGNNVDITGYRSVDANLIREVNSRTLRSSKDAIFSPVEIDTGEAKAITRRFPQSLILSLIDLGK
jgi:hypothetical protein